MVGGPFNRSRVVGLYPLSIMLMSSAVLTGNNVCHWQTHLYYNVKPMAGWQIHMYA